jgi:hypothetical protein
MNPPTIGKFKDGRGGLYDRETFNARAILVRLVISDIKPDSCRFEQAFSEDDGKTWEVNWIAIDTRTLGSKLDRDRYAHPPLIQKSLHSYYCNWLIVARSSLLTRRAGHFTSSSWSPRNQAKKVLIRRLGSSVQDASFFKGVTTREIIISNMVEAE